MNYKKYLTLIAVILFTGCVRSPGREALKDYKNSLVIQKGPISRDHTDLSLVYGLSLSRNDSVFRIKTYEHYYNRYKVGDSIK